MLIDTGATGDSFITVINGGQLTFDMSAAGGGNIATQTTLVTVSGSGSRFTTPLLHIGYGPPGGTMTFNLLDSGELAASGTVYMGASGSTGVLNIGDGGIAGILSADVTDGLGPVGNGTVRFNHSNDITYAFVMSGTFALFKEGTGTLTLTAANTLTGATTISAGALIINGTHTGSPIALTGGTLGGTGALGDVTASGGTVSPGVSPGLLTVGLATFMAGSTFFVELDGPVAGTSYDQLASTSGVALGGATLAGTAAVTHAVGTTFTIIDNQSGSPVTGTFAGLAEGATTTIGGQSYLISYIGGDGNDVTLTAVAAVPSTPFALLPALGALLTALGYARLRASA